MRRFFVTGGAGFIGSCFVRLLLNENSHCEVVNFDALTYAGNPDNMTVGFALYQAQMQNSRFDDALNTARHFSERPSSPAYFHYLEAQAWAAKQNWERAWNAWQAYRESVSKK